MSPSVAVSPQICTYLLVQYVTSTSSAITVKIVSLVNSEHEEKDLQTRLLSGLNMKFDLAYGEKDPLSSRAWNKN